MNEKHSTEFGRAAKGIAAIAGIVIVLENVELGSLCDMTFL